MSWHVEIDGKRIGPISEEALRTLIASGRLHKESLVWRTRMPEWVPAGTVSGLFAQEEIAGEQPSPAESAASASGIAPATLPAPAAPAATPDLATPWSRFWARNIDILVIASLIGFLLGVVRPSIFQEGILTGPAGSQLFGWLSLPFVMILDAIVFSVFGNTPGKWLAGIRVMRVDGQKVSSSTYVRRNFGVWWFGLGTGIPLVSLITLIVAYNKASSGEVSSWDESTGTRSFRVSSGEWRTVLTGSIYLLSMIGFGALNVARMNKPPLRPAQVVDTTPEGQLRQVAAEVRRMAPMMVDAGTRLDGASAGPGLSLTYQYTLVQFDVDEIDALQIESFQQALHPQLRESACNDSTLAPLREMGTTILFSYADKTGRQVMTLAVAPADCKP